jgi:hypothetical protein
MVRQIPDAIKPLLVAINCVFSSDNVRQLEAKAA